MRVLILILYMLLSPLFGGRLEFAEELRQSCSDCYISEYSESDRITEFTINKDICLTSAQSSSLFENHIILKWQHVRRTHSHCLCG